MDEQSQQPISDDQELAKVLAGVSQDIGAPVDQSAVTTNPMTEESASQGVQPIQDDQSLAPAIEMPTMPEAPVVAPMSGSSDLDSIKLEALNELRPLVDKLDVPAEERFDTYLLLLRSTDDRDLIAPAHQAAKNIPDEARRAQALLDIIKEIDFLSQAQK